MPVTAARALMMLQMAVEEMESLPRDARMRLSDHNDLGEYVGDLSSRLQWLADGDDDETAPVVSAQHPLGVKRMSQPYIVGPRPGTAGSARSSTHERNEETKAADVEAKDAEAAETPPAASVPALAVPAADGEAAKTPRTPPATPDGHQAVLGGDAAATSPKAPAKLPPLAGLGDQPSTRIVLDPLPARPLPGAGEN